MEDVELLSPFKSPSVNDRPSSSRRNRLCSGSSSSSNDKDALSPHNRLNFYGTTTTASSSRAGSEGRDENDPPVGCANTSIGEQSRVNPFERDILAGLQGPFWSPSILDVKETPPQRSWAIEHLSQLFPKDLENSPSTHQNSFPVDDQMEAKAQADIDVYFSRGPIVPTPSPMKQKVMINIQGDFLRLKTASAEVHCGQSPIARSLGLGGGIGLNGGNIKKLKKPVSVTERWTQTDLSLPVNLPSHVEELLFKYSQDVSSCGSSGEAVLFCSQKSEASDNAENADPNDSGKNSSSLNNSIRRRLELSFGEDLEGEESSQGLSQGFSTSPIADPFRRNHVVSTPPNSSSHFQLNTTTSDLEMQLLRCEFTPEANVTSSISATPGITPIHDDPDDGKFFPHHSSSTPRRINGTSKRWTMKEDGFIPPTSPMTTSSSTSSSSTISRPTIVRSNSSDMAQCNLLRRSRPDSYDRHPIVKKRHSASSFDDSQLLMDDYSPPAKLYRRNSKNDDTVADS